jgi:hypothetical protein
MQVRLTRKLADRLDGVDVSAYNSGDVLDITRREAELLIAEGWAMPLDSGSVDAAKSSPSYESAPPRDTTTPSALVRAEANRLCEVWEMPGRRRFDERDLRRKEDIIRDELRDSRATTVRPDKS